VFIIPNKKKEEKGWFLRARWGGRVFRVESP
jgi:hypothetical protein